MLKKLMGKANNVTAKLGASVLSMVPSKVSEVTGLQQAEKEQTNTLIGIIFILAVAITVGGIFLLFFPEIAQDVVDAIRSTFSNIINVPS